jgi:hypothetical protein
MRRYRFRSFTACNPTDNLRHSRLRLLLPQEVRGQSAGELPRLCHERLFEARLAQEFARPLASPRRGSGTTAVVDLGARSLCSPLCAQANQRRPSPARRPVMYARPHSFHYFWHVLKPGILTDTSLQVLVRSRHVLQGRQSGRAGIRQAEPRSVVPVPASGGWMLAELCVRKMFGTHLTSPVGLQARQRGVGEEALRHSPHAAGPSPCHCFGH